MTEKNDKAEADNKAEPAGKPGKNKAGKQEGDLKAKGPQHADGENKSAAVPSDPALAAKPVKAKALRNVPSGIVHINATFNNTQVTITDLKGAVLAWSSSGRMGFKGTRKSTAYAATVVAQEAARLVSSYRMQEVEVRVQGPGSGRESAIRALQAAGMIITVIKDVTPMPHNGCRARKRRRV